MEEKTVEELTPKVIETIRHAARDITGAFEARVSLDYLGGDLQLPRVNRQHDTVLVRLRCSGSFRQNMDVF